MERLTERYIPNNEKKGIAGIKVFESENKIPLAKVLSGEYLYPAIEKLATYEDLEEQGLLVRLPCKVGDIVYVPTKNFISELRIIMIAVNMYGAYFRWMLNSGIYPKLDGFSRSELGKTVFLTREEAVNKLEELENE
nr:MAG TPA: hypothetical protein [Caudoviricetes sp.]